MDWEGMLVRARTDKLHAWCKQQFCFSTTIDIGTCFCLRLCLGRKYRTDVFTRRKFMIVNVSNNVLGLFDFDSWKRNVYYIFWAHNVLQVDTYSKKLLCCNVLLGTLSLSVRIKFIIHLLQYQFALQYKMVQFRTELLRLQTAVAGPCQCCLAVQATVLQYYSV